MIGNLKNHTLEEIWHSEEAENIRKAFMRGELLGCNEQYCPDCINNSTTLDLEEKELQQLYDHLPEIPLQISLA